MHLLSTPNPYEKWQTFGDKFGIVGGIAVLLMGVVISNISSIILGMALFGVGFASLKSKSKTTKQLTTIISLVILIISIINLIKIG